MIMTCYLVTLKIESRHSTLPKLAHTIVKSCTTILSYVMHPHMPSIRSTHDPCFEILWMFSSLKYPVIKSFPIFTISNLRSPQKCHTKSWLHKSISFPLQWNQNALKFTYLLAVYNGTTSNIFITLYSHLYPCTCSTLISNRREILRPTSIKVIYSNIYWTSKNLRSCY